MFTDLQAYCLVPEQVYVMTTLHKNCTEIEAQQACAHLHSRCPAPTSLLPGPFQGDPALEEADCLSPDHCPPEEAPALRLQQRHHKCISMDSGQHVAVGSDYAQNTYELTQSCGRRWTNASIPVILRYLTSSHYLHWTASPLRAPKLWSACSKMLTERAMEACE